MLFHLHDNHRGWRKKSRRTQVSRRLFTCFEGQLHALARSADIEFQGYSFAISDCMLLTFKTKVFRALIYSQALCINGWDRLDSVFVAH